jgi:hypothetical protein
LTGGFLDLKKILILVVALFSAFTAASTVMAIAGIVKEVMKLVSALKLAAFWESVSTGGLSLIAAGIGAAAAVGLGAYAAYGDSSAPLLAGGSFKSNGPSATSTNSKNVTMNSTFNMHPASGTSAQQLDEMVKFMDGHLKNNFRNAASSLTSPVER